MPQWTSPTPSANPLTRVGRRGAERARGRALRRARDRRGGLAVRGRRRAPDLPAAPLLPGRGRRRTGAPVVLVPPMMLATEVWDVSPSSTAVGSLHEQGVDPWVVDFGAPEHEEGGLERDLTDHVLAVSDAVDRVREATGRDVHLGGYSQGGMFCYQAAALPPPRGARERDHLRQPGRHRRGDAARAARGARLARRRRPRRLARSPATPCRPGCRASASACSTRSRRRASRSTSCASCTTARRCCRASASGASCRPRAGSPGPGPALADFMRQFIAHNRMLEGGFVIDERLVTLADIECPILTVVGEVDEIAPAAGGTRDHPRRAARRGLRADACRPATSAWSSARRRTRQTWPTVAAWTRWRDGDGELPEEHPPDRGRRRAGREPRRRRARGLRAADSPAGVGANLARSVVTGAGRTARTLRAPGRGGGRASCPRLIRLDQVRPRTRISLGKLLDEQADEHPDQVFFLFEDRAHTHAAAKHRIDSIVRGLISVGVHQGEHVGVLMEPRPTALTVVAALNRLGAVAVLLRPDGDVAREAELGEIAPRGRRPRAHRRRAARPASRCWCSAAAARPRDLGPGVVDMERIDPDEVELPGWYKPNPGRARDLAFILFTGSGERTRPNRITNRRWILSALGTASSAALSRGRHRLQRHARLPPVRADGEPRRRDRRRLADRAGAVVRPRDVLGRGPPLRRHRRLVHLDDAARPRRGAAAPERAPPPGAPVHGLRHAARACGGGSSSASRPPASSSSTPRPRARWCWRTSPARRSARWAGRCPARRGSRSRRSTSRRGLETTPSGFARECETGEVGVLVAEVDPDVNATTETPLRGVFKPDDAWLATGDLFRRDADGDYWLLDSITALIRTEHGPVPPTPIRDALWTLPAVDLAVCFGVARPRSSARRGGRRRDAPRGPGDRGRATSPTRSGTLKPEERPALRPRRRRDPGHHLVPAGPLGPPGAGHPRRQRRAGVRARRRRHLHRTDPRVSFA